MKSLKNLDLYPQPEITDISPLRGLPLVSLSINGSKVKDISPLEGMPLTHLTLPGSVTSLEPLRGMKLKTLYYPGEASLEPLRGMPLKDLDLAGGTPHRKTSDLTPLADCQKLESIHIPDKHGDIDFLKKLPNLKTITYQNKKMTVDEFFRQQPQK